MYYKLKLHFRGIINSFSKAWPVHVGALTYHSKITYETHTDIFPFLCLGRLLRKRIKLLKNLVILPFWKIYTTKEPQ